ncbi:MAG: tetratricopeptide repeat protein [Planctomycetes bacterium]|nr:tetratricopeptide repeat protein [Planctomycetota bacterium]
MRHERPLLGSERVESATCCPADVRDQRFTVGRRSQPTGQIPRRPRTRWLCLLIALWCSSPLSFGLEHHDTDFGRSGQFELHAKALRMQRVRLHLPDMKLVDYTGKEEPGKEEPDSPEWQVTLRQEPEDPSLRRLRLEQTTDVVRRRVEYVIGLEQEDSTSAALTPVIATETAVDIDSGVLLYRSQTIEWTIEDPLQETTNSVNLGRTALWVLDHLQQVYSTEILDVCTDYFGHHSDPRGSPYGFGSSVACINRRIEIDPQDIEAYTLNAWLLWSDWVTWKLHPNRISDGEGKAEEAVRLIKKGRAANPDSAAYHFDAALTLEPLAHHHRPELMPFVIRYYLYAEDLATETALRIRIRLNLGHRFRQEGKTEEAIRWYRAVLEIDPENRVAHRYLDKGSAINKLDNLGSKCAPYLVAPD